MRDDTKRQTVVFNDLFGKQVVARFDQPVSSSDGGALLLKACDERLGLTRAIAACIEDTRQPGKVIHTLEDLVRQRVFAIACGYEDCNDAARLGADPMQKLLLERDPITGESLASQPTLSRFENALGAKTHFARMAAMGMIFSFTLYVVINAGMVMGLAPVVGVPLPLVSYGGTMMLTIMAGFGILMSAHMSRDQDGLGGL